MVNTDHKRRNQEYGNLMAKTHDVVEKAKDEDCVRNTEGEIVNLFTLYENKTDKPCVEKWFPDFSFWEIEKIPVTILGAGYSLGRVKQGIGGGGYFIGDEGDQGTLVATDVHYAYTFLSNLHDKLAAIKFAGKWDSCIPVLNKYLKSELKSEDEFITLIDLALRAALDGFCITANVSREYGFYEIKLLNPENGTGSEAAD